MRCPICKHGETHAGEATVTLERSGTAIVFRHVPAEICENCGEAFHNESVTAALLDQAGQAAAAGAEIDVRRFSVAA